MQKKYYSSTSGCYFTIWCMAINHCKVGLAKHTSQKSKKICPTKLIKVVVIQNYIGLKQNLKNFKNYGQALVQPICRFTDSYQVESEPVSRSPEPSPLTSLANQQIPELLRGRSDQATERPLRSSGIWMPGRGIEFMPIS